MRAPTYDHTAALAACRAHREEDIVPKIHDEKKKQALEKRPAAEAKSKTHAAAPAGSGFARAKAALKPKPAVVAPKAPAQKAAVAPKAPAHKPAVAQKPATAHKPVLPAAAPKVAAAQKPVAGLEEKPQAPAVPKLTKFSSAEEPLAQAIAAAQTVGSGSQGLTELSRALEAIKSTVATAVEGTEFNAKSDLSSRMHMTAEQKHGLSEVAEEHAAELQAIVDAVEAISAMVAHSPDAALLVDRALEVLHEAHSDVDHIADTFGSEGFFINSGEKKQAAAAPPPAAARTAAAAPIKTAKPPASPKATTAAPAAPKAAKTKSAAHA